ncbi:hypothetical protein ACIQ7Q_19620 [Streptomyces sp. NPDC096176]|uniref:hypothetical protein n=1 Tax=Streptomyces sp. NPDC096176 TaxID=3366079 RepID=UPI00381B90B7
MAGPTGGCHDGEAVTPGTRLVVTPEEGEAAQTPPSLLDIGTWGELDVTAWARGPHS